MALEVLPGIDGTVSRPWGGLPAGPQSLGAAAMLDREAKAGVPEIWNLELPSACWRYQGPAPGGLGFAWPWALPLKVQALVAWRLSVPLCWALAASVGPPPEAIDRPAMPPPQLSQGVKYLTKRIT